MSYPRYLKTKLLKFLKTSPVTLLTGGRQTGKTTLVKEIALECGYHYISLDDLRILGSAKDDPMGFLDQFPNPLIIDEVQRAPELALPIKLKVDENRHSGMYILTGSSNPLVAPRLNDSLAGRMFITNLAPLAQSEIQATQSKLLESLFGGSFKKQYMPVKKNDLISLLLKGGYPLVQTLPQEMHDEWFNNHLRTLLERDILDLTQIRKLESLPNLMQLLANRASSLLNVSEISRSSRIPYSTLSEYLALLQALFLTVRLPSWHKNLNKKLVKSPKAYICDSGMMAFLLGVNEERLLKNPSMMGILLENFVITEIEKLISFSSLRLKAYHYRTASGIEVDLLLENPAGELVGIEIKSADTVRSDDFKGLRFLKEELKDLFVKGVVLYPGKDTLSFGADLYALPIASLWES